jgi:hypothetical protein
MNVFIQVLHSDAINSKFGRLLNTVINIHLMHHNRKENIDIHMETIDDEVKKIIIYHEKAEI